MKDSSTVLHKPDWLSFQNITNITYSRGKPRITFYLDRQCFPQRVWYSKEF